jgi:hypothetical protein
VSSGCDIARLIYWILQYRSELICGATSGSTAETQHQVRRVVWELKEWKRCSLDLRVRRAQLFAMQNPLVTARLSPSLFQPELNASSFVSVSRNPSALHLPPKYSVYLPRKPFDAHRRTSWLDQCASCRYAISSPPQRSLHCPHTALCAKCSSQLFPIQYTLKIFKWYIQTPLQPQASSSSGRFIVGT